MKPIETSYAGCRFRSRTEARWAVVFDALGEQWRYELEGFELSDGTRYLPDFYLPNQRAWIEVKPQLDHREAKWRRFFEDLVEETGFAALASARRRPWNGPTPDRAFMVPSIPDVDDLMPEGAVGPEPVRALAVGGYMLGPGSPHFGWAFGSCLACGRIAIGHVAFESPLGCHEDLVDPEHPAVLDALTRGRQARFEHGESPG
jgi:hypothetical protein